MRELAAMRQRGKLAGLIGAVEAAIDTNKLGPLAKSRLIQNANAVCDEFDFERIRQDNDSEADLDARLAAVKGAMS